MNNKKISYKENVIPLFLHGNDYAVIFHAKINEYFDKELQTSIIPSKGIDCPVEYHVIKNKDSYSQTVTSHCRETDTHFELLRSHNLKFRLYLKIDSDICIITLLETNVVVMVSDIDKFDSYFCSDNKPFDSFCEIWNLIKIMMLENVK